MKKRYTEQDVRDAIAWDDFLNSLLNDGDPDPIAHLSEDEAKKKFDQLRNGYLIGRNAYLASAREGKEPLTGAHITNGGKVWYLVAVAP